MRVCGIDLETTGLDFQKDYITEMAWIIKDIGDPKPLIVKSELVQIPILFELPADIIALTKITRKHLDLTAGQFFEVVKVFISDVQCLDVDYIVAHNGELFDKPMLSKIMERERCNSEDIQFLIKETPWLDTRNDIQYPDSWSKSLRYVAAELGFLNPFPHSALFDVATMLKVLEHFNIEDVITRNKEPWVVLKGCVDYANREKAKKRRFSWEQAGDKTYPKTWVKRVKASDAYKEISDADFQIVILEE